MQYIGAKVNKKYNILINYFNCIRINEFLKIRIHHGIGVVSNGFSRYFLIFTKPNDKILKTLLQPDRIKW